MIYIYILTSNHYETYIEDILSCEHPMYLLINAAVSAQRTAFWQKGQVWEMNAITS